MTTPNNMGDRWPTESVRSNILRAMDGKERVTLPGYTSEKLTTNPDSDINIQWTLAVATVGPHCYLCMAQ